MLLNRIAVIIAFFINGFIYGNLYARLPRIQELYNADNGTISIVLLALSVGAVGAMPFTGWIIIKNGSRRITIFAAFLYCVITPAIPFMSGITSLAFLFFIMGISSGMLDVAMNAQAVMVEQNYKRPIMTSFHAFFSIGMALGGACCALFVMFEVDLFYNFLVVSTISFVAVGWSRMNLIYDTPDASIPHDGPLFRLPTPTLLGIGIIAFCCMMGEGAMGDWSVNYMEHFANSKKTVAPIGLAAFAAAMTLGRIFGDRARTRFGDKKLIILGGLIATIGLSLALLFPQPMICIIGFFVVGIGLSTIVPITYSIAGNVKGLPSGVGLSMVTTVGYSAFFFGPPIIGFLADWQTLRIALATIVFLFVIMTILGARYNPK